MKKYTVIVLAAGSGKRMGAGKNKLLIKLNEIPIIVHTIMVFQLDTLCERIILVVNEEEQETVHNWMSQFEINKVTDIVVGGKERQDSVFQGLQCIQEECMVLIHDGARPFIKRKYIHQVKEAAESNGGAVLAVPVKDTIKKVQNKRIVETINRSLLWAIQTPQAFRYNLIYKAHKRAQKDGFIGTDDASVVERLGESVVIVPSDYENIKITTPEDIYFANVILNNRHDE